MNQILLCTNGDTRRHQYRTATYAYVLGLLYTAYRGVFFWQHRSEDPAQKKPVFCLGPNQIFVDSALHSLQDWNPKKKVTFALNLGPALKKKTKLTGRFDILI